MTDLIAATQDAVFGALNVSAVTGLAPVFTSVPADQRPPFVEIGAINAEEFEAGKMPGVEQHTIEVHCRTRDGGRMPLLAILAAVRVRLESASMTAAGAAPSRAQWRETLTDRADDGVTWVGLHRFTLLTQQA